MAKSKQKNCWRWTSSYWLSNVGWIYLLFHKEIEVKKSSSLGFGTTPATTLLLKEKMLVAQYTLTMIQPAHLVRHILWYVQIENIAKSCRWGGPYQGQEIPPFPKGKDKIYPRWLTLFAAMAYVCMYVCRTIWAARPSPRLKGKICPMLMMTWNGNMSSGRTALHCTALHPLDVNRMAAHSVLFTIFPPTSYLLLPVSPSCILISQNILSWIFYHPTFTGATACCFDMDVSQQISRM